MIYIDSFFNINNYDEMCKHWKHERLVQNESLAPCAESQFSVRVETPQVESDNSSD